MSCNRPPDRRDQNNSLMNRQLSPEGVAVCAVLILLVYLFATIVSGWLI